jgi:hypothetical protein
MARVIKKLVLVFLLGWVPLQASALPLIALLCDHDPVGMHGHAAAHGHHGQGEPSGHDRHGDGSDDGSPPPPSPSCCHNLTSAMMPGITAGAAGKAEGVAPMPLPHLYSFVPELPQPPPLAA